MSSPSSWGTDRASERPDGSRTLVCRLPKGWTARRKGSGLRTAHPGTCIRWDDELFEVHRIDSTAHAVTYTLAPWEDQHAIRAIESYDEQSEKQRTEAREDARRRESRRRVSILLALALGHLPEFEQKRWEREYGASPQMMTLVSAAPIFVIGTLSLLLFLISIFGSVMGGSAPPVADSVLLVGIYFFIESMVRIGVVLSQSRGIGSLAGTIVAAMVLPKKPHPPTKLDSTRRFDDSDQKLRDWFTMTEALLALLRASDQKRLVERFEFDPLRWGRVTAWAILAMASAGLASSFVRFLHDNRMKTLVAIAVAGFLFVEQIARLRSLSRDEPMGSVLGFVVRPFVRRLLS